MKCAQTEDPIAIVHLFHTTQCKTPAIYIMHNYVAIKGQYKQTNHF